MTKIPKIDNYVHEDSMSSEQRKFYEIFVINLEKNDFVDLENNNWYLEIYLENLVCLWDEIGIELLLEKLLVIESLYDKKIEIISIKNYINECLLALEKYDEFLIKTKTYNINDHFFDIIYSLRLSLQKKLNLQADPLDIYCLQSPRTSEIIDKYPDLYRETIIKVFNEYGKNKSSWFEFIEKKFQALIKPQDYYIFETNNINKKNPYKIINFTFYNFYDLAFGINGLQSLLRQLTTKVENIVRTEIGLEKKEVAWFTETLVYDFIKENFPNEEIFQHGKPKWLGKQHYDIWIPKWKIAIEFHGDQHFISIDKWGGEKALQKTKERDSRKRFLSKQNDVDLFEIDDSTNMIDLIDDIKIIMNLKKVISF